MKGDTVRRQTEKAEAWCQRNEIILDLRLSDEGLSAFRGQNADEGALKDFLDAIKSGKVRPGDYLIVESLDRLSRQQLGTSQLLVQGILAAGVNIVTLSPERVFTKSGTNELGQSIEILVVLSRANDESQVKSERVAAAWSKKREKAAKEKLTKRGCSWLQLSDDRSHFIEIENRVEVLRRIFDLAESVGITAIANILNSECVATFRSDENRKEVPRWRTSTVRRFLTSRTVLGEFQPHVQTETGRKPTGKPISDYYPRIIDDDQFYRVQAAIKSRRLAGGPVRNRVSNLFSKRLYDKKGEPFIYRESNPGEAYLRTPTNSMPYILFETTLLLWASDLDVDDVMPVHRVAVANTIPHLTDRVSGLEIQIADLKTRIKTSREGGPLYDLLEEFDDELQRNLHELEQAKIESSTSSTEALLSLKELMERMKDVDGDERWHLRARLRRLLRRIVKRIVCRAHSLAHGGYYIGAKVELENGNQRLFGVQGTRAQWNKHGFDLDIEGAVDFDYSDDINHYQHFDLESICPELAKYRNRNEQVQSILRQGKEGKPLKEIVETVGVSMTVVSRTLVKHGLRRTSKKPKGHPHKMNWHEAARGWVRIKNKKRYYVGCGTLREHYPKLVKGDGTTAETTWNAANIWWDENGPE